MNWLHSVFISNNAKLWTNIVYAVATYKILMTPLKEIDSGIFLWWMAIVGGVELAKRVIAGKMGVTSEEPGQTANTVETTTVRKEVSVQSPAEMAPIKVDVLNMPDPKVRKKVKRGR